MGWGAIGNEQSSQLQPLKAQALRDGFDLTLRLWRISRKLRPERVKTGVLESDVFAVPRVVQPAIIAARLTLSVSPLPNLTLGPNSPPDGFYEWRREETGKSRHRFT